MALFKRKPFLDENLREWQFDTFAWLFENFGGHEFFRRTQLILPTRDFFPSPGLEGHELAQWIFDRVRDHAGLAHWPCELVAQDRDPDTRLGPTMIVQGLKRAPLGTFSLSEEPSESVRITYNPDLLQNRVSLVATFAHELSHYLIAAAQSEPPGGWESHEFVTDLTSVFLGFGIFLVNSSFNFRQFTGLESEGWSYQKQGYLSERDLLYALAIFGVTLNIEPGDVTPHLKTWMGGDFKKAIKEVAAMDTAISRLRRI